MAGGGAMVSAATGALGSVLEKLAAMLGGACVRLMGVRGDVLFLRAELEHMSAFLIKLSRVEDPDEQARCWMAEVRELSYDIEDSVDEFTLCVDDDDRSAHPLPGFRGFIDRSINLLTKIKTRRRVAREIQCLKDRVREVGERRARYKIDESVCVQANDVAVDPRVCSLYNDVSQLVGIDGPKKELIKLLEEGDGASAHKLKVVSIVGFGGMGKTTLANQIYHTFGKKFKYRAFISVSRNPDIIKVLRGILSQLSNQGYSSTEVGDERQLIGNILSFLADKRYFIVIDDVWSVEAWEIIRCAIPENNFGSRIITTTRIKGVAKTCSSPHANHVYELRPLSVVHSKGLFLKRIFNSEKQCPPHLSRTADDILRRCGGLPLAIITISGLLANKDQTVDQWDEVQSSISYALQRYPSVERMMKILSLSYFDLHHDLKTCLLYLSLFPEDYPIEKSRLIRRWIAEGFIQGKSGHSMYELGERCFNELINRSLIQPWGVNLFGEVTGCLVHDTVHEFILCKSIEENFVTLLGIPNLTIKTQSKVRRLSLLHKSNREVILQPNLNFSHVRSLSLFGRSMEIPSLVKSRFLRVLDLEDCRLLEGHHLDNIWNLFELKYLSLSNTSICELPEQIGGLQKLETLNLEFTSITALPSTIVRLQRLVHLLIDRGVRLWDETGNMQGLEELKVLSLLEQSTSFFVEIGLLTNMRDLSIFWDIPTSKSSSYLKKRKRDQSLLENSNVYINNVVDSICKLGSIHSLSLDMGYGCEDVLQESWHPAPQSLRKLAIMGAIIKNVPNWVGSLVNLQQLDLNVEEVRQEDLTTFGSLPGLLHLYLCVGMERNNRSYNVHLTISRCHGFTCLRHLHIGGENCGLALMLETGSLPKLESLELEFDAIETGRLTNLDLAFGIQHLPCLASISCDINSLGEILPSSKAMMAAIERVVSTHPNHPRHQIRILG